MQSTADPKNIHVCARCGIQYDWRRSPSSYMKMTYCGSLCERGDLGFTIEALLRYERSTPAVQAPALVPTFSKRDALAPAA